IITDIIKHDDDRTQISLLFANQSEDDILCRYSQCCQSFRLRKELDELALKHSDKFRVWYTVDRPSDDWKFSKGFVNDEMIKVRLSSRKCLISSTTNEHLPGPSDDSAVFMCGPPPMINMACIPSLERLGYNASNRFQF
ncbi:unnamed protein product, partial [Strongylus vulgaris]